MEVMKLSAMEMSMVSDVTLRPNENDRFDSLDNHRRTWLAKPLCELGQAHFKRAAM